MYWLIVLVFIGLPIGLAAFLIWRAYRIAFAGQVSLCHQWLPLKAPGIEKYAKLLAARDLIFALGCLLFVALLLVYPAYFTVWPSLLAAFGFLHQGITYYAVHKVQHQGQGPLQ